MQTLRYQIREWLWLAFWLVGLSGFFVLTKAPEYLNRVFYDRFLQAQQREIQNDFLLIAIDDRSLTKLGRWPWSRDVHAGLLNKLSQAGVRQIALDLLLTEKSQNSIADQSLQIAIQSGVPVLLPALRVEDPSLSNFNETYIKPSESLGLPDHRIVHIEVNVDSDGVVRSLPLELSGGIQALSVALAKGMNTAVSLDESSFSDYLIPFAGPSGRVPQVSYVDVLEGLVPPEVLIDKTVVIGVTAQGLGDSFVTPLDVRMPGAELHIHAADGFKKGMAIRVWHPLASWGFAFLMVAGVLMCCGKSSPRVFGLAVITAIPSAFAIVWFLFCQFSLYLSPSLALLCLMLLYPLWSWRRLAGVDRYAQRQLQQLEPEIKKVCKPRPSGIPRKVDYVSHQLELVEQMHNTLRQVEHDKRTQKDELIRFLSHDLKAPQTSILAILEDLERCGDLPVSFINRIDAIADNARRTLVLGEQFLDEQRLSYENLHPVEVQINNIVYEVLHQLSPLASKKTVLLSFDESNLLAYVLADHQLLSRVFQNLIDNAIKYSPEGGRVVISVEWMAEQKQLNLYIDDEGPGVPVHKRTQIFAPFEQLGGKTQKKGYGLGLAFVQKVMAHFGGTVACAESPSGGARFMIAIPCDAVENLI